MQKLHATILSLLLPVVLMAQGWPANYGGVMLQGFYWDSFDDSNWTVLQAQADELSQSFDLIWVPQSGNCGGTSMGYDDLYWFNNYNSSFGNEQQLRSMIAAFRAKGLKTIADVVINHRRNVSNWVDFPRETYKGVTYEMVSTDICANDDDGATKTWATQNGYQLSANNDTGEGWGGMRDLDHKSQNVQTIVKAYLDFLKNDLGYAGFRYDMVKGYSASFTSLYNQSAQPEFSVGEYWDGNADVLKTWLEGTRADGAIQSAAFDFPFRYTVRDAVNGNWARLGNTTLVNAVAYRRYAVTFVENHDTESRSNGEVQDPLKRDTLAANAFMLAMPGTPCVFLKHWQAYPTELKSMIEARKTAGITNTSGFTNVREAQAFFANMVDNKLLVVVGNTSQYVPDAAMWVKVLSGPHYAYYFPVTMNIPWVDLASSTYEGEQKATLTAVTAQSGAQLAYSLNGGPTYTVPSGAQLTIPVGTTTLSVGLVVGGSVDQSTVVTRTYVVKENKVEPQFEIPSFCTVAEGEMCAFFEAPLTWTSTIQCWAWDTGNYTGGKWPGVDCQRLGTASNGYSVWKWTWDNTYTGTNPAQPTGIIFSNSGSPQTADFSFVNGGYYTKDGLQGKVSTGISPVWAQTQNKDAVYTLDGRRMTGQQRKGIYILNNRKYWGRTR
ncbi:MAG: starch-binding protein [Prevotella sp.]|nr:starch-binding protein [Prevotella sp.]